MYTSPPVNTTELSIVETTGASIAVEAAGASADCLRVDSPPPSSSSNLWKYRMKTFSLHNHQRTKKMPIVEARGQEPLCKRRARCAVPNQRRFVFCFGAEASPVAW